MTIAFVAYLVGFFLTYGYVLGYDDDLDFGSFIAAFICGLFSWIAVGIIWREIVKKSKVEKTSNNENRI